MNTPDLRDLRQISDVMDKHFRGPFGWRFGWDGLLGLVPIVGDFVTNSVSVYIIFRAAALGCPASVILRMGTNLAIENVIDVIPFFGNIFDFVWKANCKNLVLVENYFANPSRVHSRSRWFIAFSVALVLAVVIGTLVLAIYTLKLILGFLGDVIP